MIPVLGAAFSKRGGGDAALACGSHLPYGTFVPCDILLPCDTLLPYKISLLFDATLLSIEKIKKSTPEITKNACR